MDDFTVFSDSVHMFEWANEPYHALIRRYIESAMANAVPGVRVDKISCYGAPRYVSAAKENPEDSESSVITRMGVAFEAQLDITLQDGEQDDPIVVCTMICQNLDEPEGRRIWLELESEGDIKLAEEDLKEKIYEDASQHPMSDADLS